MPTPPRPARTGLLLDGRYLLRHVLGEGGFAVVYLAHDQRLHAREVAVKVLHPELLTSPDHVSRFAQEIKVAARIGAGCEHLVKITDHGRSDEPPLLYFVMEYLTGPSLRQVLADLEASALAGRRVQRPLPWPRAVTLALQLSAAITALHRQGVIHRDIKPENIIIDASGVGDLLKLLDYGIAKLTPGAAISGDGPKTAVSHVLGTPRYMAPEQLHDGVCDHRVDIYAVGAILDELLTARSPPPPGAPPPSPPSQACPAGAIPPALDALVLRATAWDPADRFATAEALSAALIAVLRDAAAVAAADDATTLAAARGAGSPPLLPERGPALAVAVRDAPHTVALAAHPAPARVTRDRSLLWLARLSGFTFLTSSTLGCLALVFALFTVVRHTRSQAASPTDRLLRDDDVRAQPEADERIRPPRPVLTPTQPLLEPEPPAPEPTPEPMLPAPEPAPVPTLPEPEPPAPAQTIEQIVRAAERKIRARCGARGGDRMVEYTLVFAPGSQRLVDVRVEGEHQARELGDCVETAARAIDFRGARDRVRELPRALYRM